MENKSSNNDYELTYIQDSVSGLREQVALLEKKTKSLEVLISSLKKLWILIGVLVIIFAILLSALNLVNQSEDRKRKEPLKAILVVGGQGPSEDVSTSVELFTGDKFSCLLDIDLPDKRMHHTLSTISGYSLVCGGSWSNTDKTCLQLNKYGVWEKFIILPEGREEHVAWEHDGDIFLLGGAYNVPATADRVTNARFDIFPLKNTTK